MHQFYQNVRDLVDSLVPVGSGRLKASESPPGLSGIILGDLVLHDQVELHMGEWVGAVCQDLALELRGLVPDGVALRVLVEHGQ